MTDNWLNELIDFYDFIWCYGIEAHGHYINDKIRKDFAEGGDNFKKMCSLILKKFPTRQSALLAFKKFKINQKKVK